jgi:hypothetical protein
MAMMIAALEPPGPVILRATPPLRLPESSDICPLRLRPWSDTGLRAAHLRSPMSDATPPPAAPDQPWSQPAAPPPYPQYAESAAQAGLTPQPYGGSEQLGTVGQIRGTGFGILIFIVTFGIYGWYWYYKTHSEMKAHSGQGIGGGLALVLAILVSVVMPFITSSEVGSLYSRRGQPAPVSAMTGLWNFPGVFIIVGPIVWFVKTNGALNDYWRSQGAIG